MAATPESQLIAFALGYKEATYATAIVDAHLLAWIPANSVDFPELGIRYRDDAADINGKLDVTEREVEHRSGKKAWKFDASAESLLWGFGMQWGVIVMTGSGDPYTGTVKKRALCTISPPSFSYFHGLNCSGSTGTFFVRKGAVVSQQTVEIPNVGPIKQTIELMDDGSLTADTGFVVPSAPTTVKKLLGAYSVVQFGVAGSLVNLSTAKRVRHVKITSNSNIQDVENQGGGVYVNEYQFGEKAPTIEVELTIKGDESSAEFGYFNQAVTPTALQLDITVDPSVTPARSWRFLMTSCHIIGCQQVAKGNETNLVLKIGGLYSSADTGPAQVIGKTAQPTYLVADA